MNIPVKCLALATFCIVFFFLTAEAQTPEDCYKILGANNFYQTPEKYKDYGAQEFDRDVKQALAEGREDDAKHLRRIELLKAYGVGYCTSMYRIPQGILIGTVIEDERVEEGIEFKEKHVCYIYSDWTDDYKHGTLKRITELDDCQLCDYSKSLNDRILVGKIMGLDRSGEKYVCSYFTFQFETKQFVFQFNASRNAFFGVHFDKDLKNIKYQTYIKNKKTPDNPLGVGNHVETFTVSIKN